MCIKWCGAFFAVLDGPRITQKGFNFSVAPAHFFIYFCFLNRSYSEASVPPNFIKNLHKKMLILRSISPTKKRRDGKTKECCSFFSFKNLFPFFIRFTGSFFKPFICPIKGYFFPDIPPP